MIYHKNKINRDPFSRIKREVAKSNAEVLRELSKMKATEEPNAKPRID